ncbi:MAG: NFACT RNA binding domain-containing protein [Candidatus Micrarchaeia archaeon]|jgi:predicted ribosome quality control (RQC) complex YloA/Tae2 family protein
MPSITLSTRKSVHENAAIYYEEAKRSRSKADGARKSIVETEKRIADLDKKIAAHQAVQLAKPALKLRREKQWFEKFHHFITSDNTLVIAGSDAKQNEMLVAKHLEEGDLFMHADIHGAPATIIKGGQSATERSLEEAAQFSGSYSSAWKSGLSSVDVYAVKPDQVSKHSHGEVVPKGGFMIKGEKKYFRGAKLGLRIGIRDGLLITEPEMKNSPDLPILLHAGGSKEKGDLAKELAKKLGCEVDELLQLLPSGNGRIA